MKTFKQSFTLIEVLVVLVIIGILSALIIVGVSNTTKDARDSRRKAEMNAVRKAIWVESSMGSKGYPTTPDLGSGARGWCCVGTSGTNCTNLNAALSGYSLPKDPNYNPSNQEWCYMYKSDGTTFDLYAKLEGKGAISLSPESVQITTVRNDCPVDWIDTGLGFCVMKYEARNQSGVPTSMTGGTIWTTISQIDAIAACKSIGAHLINNAEWMALARDIESVSSNYASGILKRGNVGITDAGSYDGANPDTGIADTKAQLTLSNGQTIWHLSGNVWEWVDFTITGAGSQPQVVYQTPFGWQEFTAVTNYGNTLGRDNVAPKSTSLNGSTGAGRIYYQSDYASLRALVRGGFWDNTSNAGVFALGLYNGPTSARTGIGFRCAR
ncbi:MAG: type II secretion system protein [Candidatus Paceibacterota bacterium]|jgi:type II secretory pathway pseudopilin PulG